MHNAPATPPSKPNHHALLQRLKALLAHDRKTTARLLWHLGEVDARGLYRDAGYSTMFAYCSEALHMSESEASLRIRAARMSRDYPVVLGMVERGQLHLSALRVLSPVLTRDNHQRLLRTAVHKSKREVELLVADLAPKPDALDRLRKLPSASTRTEPPAALPLLETSSGGSTSGASTTAVPQPSQQPAASKVTPSRVEPLGQARYRLQLTADATLHDQLRQAQALMRHQVPDGDLSTILGKAMTLLLESLRKQRFAEVTRPRARRSPGLAGDAGDAGDAQVAGAATGQRRHIPASVRRSVAQRDGHRCTFVSEDGHRCGEMSFVEFHHDHAYARGGRHDVDNLRLLCRAHNALLAERDFGRPFMRAKQGRNAPQGQAQFSGMSPP